ncbi:GL24539 [Drosophila persimilis]|uniref:GL24539 n=1 Tax=Drosophila persimilis TaxID=7234 RepID=B4G4J3_DROPE|nr:GL24539 [Drosophila persimilis]
MVPPPSPVVGPRMPASQQHHQQHHLPDGSTVHIQPISGGQPQTIQPPLCAGHPLHSSSTSNN